MMTKLLLLLLLLILSISDTACAWESVSLIRQMSNTEQLEIDSSGKFWLSRNSSDHRTGILSRNELSILDSALCNLYNSTGQGQLPGMVFPGWFDRETLITMEAGIEEIEFYNWNGDSGAIHYFGNLARMFIVHDLLIQFLDINR